MKTKYNSEIEGMIDFYKELGLSDDVDYSCNTDGRLNGCLNEFKLVFTDLNAHKKQVLRYLISYNAIAKPIPAKVLLIDLNGRRYIEGDVLTKKDGIEVVWGDELQDWLTPAELIKYYNLNSHCKGWVTESSIISYNNLFCSTNNKKTTSKDEVKNELISPSILNIHPFDWYGQVGKEKKGRDSNNWLTFNMNMLGSEILKKQLGAFFTPDEYVKISTEYLRNAIKNVPDGKDYVIIDRCAGTGNLEKFLTEDELSHCILNTIDYTEWTTLKGLYEGRVRYIIPHNAKSRNDEDDLMRDGDALQKEFYDKLLPMIKDKYIIMLENPPFAGTAGIRGGAKGTLKNKKFSYINLQMKLKGYDGNHCKDLLTQFVWSAFEIINCNEYILYGPIIWWKSNHILDKKYIRGHMCNKKKFNSGESGILLGHWENKNVKNKELECSTDIGKTRYVIKKKNTFITSILDPYKINIDKSNLRTPEEDELGLLFSTSSTLDALNGGLFNRGTYRTELVTSAGLKLTKLNKDNLKKLSVIQCANCYKPIMYYEKDVVMKSADKNSAFEKDEELLADSLLFVLLSEKTKCISNKSLINKMCLSQGTIVDSLLTEAQRKSNLVKLWEDLLKEVKKCAEYNKYYKYGLYQIQKEINIKVESGSFTKKGEPIMVLKYPALDEKIKKLKSELKDFYNERIEKKLFEYELLK